MKPTPIPKHTPTRHYQTRHLPLALWHRVDRLARSWRTTREDAFNIVIEAGVRAVEKKR